MSSPDKRLVLVACLTCGDGAHVPEGAAVAAWHLAHACTSDAVTTDPEEARDA